MLSIGHWLIVLLIIALVFGTKKLRNIGTDLGSALKGFKEGLNQGEGTPPSSSPTPTRKDTIDVTAHETK